MLSSHLLEGAPAPFFLSVSLSVSLYLSVSVPLSVSLEAYLSQSSSHPFVVYLPKSTKARWKSSVDASVSAEAFDEIVTSEFTDYEEYIEFHGQIRPQYNSLCLSVASASPQATVLFLLKKTQELVQVGRLSLQL
jgi:hypothetical protein